MAVSKDAFAEYANSRENDHLSKAMKEKKYSHNKVFDDVPNTSKNDANVEDQIISIDPNQVVVASFKVDRKNITESSIHALADNIEQVGQLQPCTVRILNQKSNKQYELIYGERRYLAALSKGLKLKVVVKNINNTEAGLMLVSENLNRDDGNDFSFSEQLVELLNGDMLKQQDIVSKLGISKQRVSRLLSFRKIPEHIFQAINDFSKVTAGTAEKIKQLCAKGEKYEHAVLSLADKISSGEIGHEKLSTLVEKKVSSDGNYKKERKKYFTTDGRMAFSVGEDNNSNKAIHFSKGVDVTFYAEKLLRIMNNDVIDIQSPTRGT